MKKLTTIICTIAMLASLTACSSNDAPSGDFTDDKQIVVNDPADKAPESTPKNNSDNNSEDKNESVPDEKTESKTDEKASGNTDSKPDEKAPDNAGDKTDGKNDTSAENGENNSTEDTDKETSENKTDDKNEQASALPLKQYPDGSYFTYDGKPCTDHDKCNWDVDCNCVNFDLSIQSMGFAKYVYFQVTGKHVSSENRTEINADITAETAKAALKDLPLGTYIAVTQGNGVPHFMTVVGTDENGITVYQANYGGGCVVRVTDFSWADFAAKFPQLDYIVK